MPRFLVLYQWQDQHRRWDVMAADAETAARDCLNTLQGHPRAVAARWTVYAINFDPEWFESRPTAVQLRPWTPPQEPTV